MDHSTPEYLVIVNPNAGRRKGENDWHIISAFFNKYNISHRVFFTKERHHAIDLTSTGIHEGFRKIIVVGGDGTMNEVVNGCFNQKVCPTTDITLSIVTVGTGNDWGKLFNIPNDYEGAIKVIKENCIRLQDTGLVSYFHGTEKSDRYFINIAGLGFDAMVVKRTNFQKDKGKGGKAVYFWCLLKSLLFYKHVHTEVVIDGKKFMDQIFTISLGIGKYSGGGMLQTPDAVPDDGLFDITVIKKMSKLDVIRSLNMLYDGTILNHPKIEGFKGKDILIDADPLIHVEADGESLGHSPIEFSIIPQSINVVVNKNHS